MTGEEGSFVESISFDDLKEQLLINYGYDPSVLTSKEVIDMLYAKMNLDQCTVIPNINTENKITSLGTFETLLDGPTNKFYKFDLYISPVQKYDKNSGSDFKMDVFLGENMLTGHTKNRPLFNPFTYDEHFVNPMLALLPADSALIPLTGGDVVNDVTIDSKQAARVAFEKYEVVTKGHPELYSGLSPKSAIIYQDSDEYPYYNSANGVTNLGGILGDGANLAIGYWNSFEYRFIHSEIIRLSLPDSIKNTRGVNGVCPDVVLSKNTNHLIDSNNIDEQIGINQMMKVTVYFWFEGWDADCMTATNFSPVNISIRFNMNNED